MTEVEWNASTDPVAMLDWLVQHHKPSDRKLRLAACADFRLQAFGELMFARVDLLEQFADGEIEREKAIRKIEGDPFDWSLWYEAHPNAEEAARLSLAELPGGRAAHILRDIINPFRPVTLPVDCITPLVRSLAEAAYQERREDGTLDPDRLMVLSDALEEAGMPTDETCCRCGGTGSLGGGRKVPASRTKLCDACGGRLQLPHPLLAHLRSPGPHYRGCWAIDLLTGRR